MPSSAIRHVQYSAPRRQLLITFASGKTYVYDRVPERVNEAFAAASSKGTFFNRYIRDRYRFREVVRLTG
jgi:hypothetical protein